jgi:LCP family protein required for cell wall assembly
VAAGAIGYLNKKVGAIHRLALGSVLTPVAGGSDAAQNYLILGADSDAGLNALDPSVRGRGDVTGARADTIMILHVDPKATQARLLSLPRDTWVKINGTETEAKINAAIEAGGVPALITTIQDNFDIPINHFVEVDFLGFKQLVEAIGGVPVYFDTPVRDFDPATGVHHTALDIQSPGCYTLDPDEALAYARSRYLQFKKNGRWQSDPTSDLGRISRQQDFIKQALKRAIAKGIRNPFTLNELLNAGIKSVTIDGNLTVGDLFNLGRKFRSFDPSNLLSEQLPTYGVYYQGQAIQRVLPEKAAPMLAPFQGTQQATGAAPLPAEVEVAVLNGSGRPNEATKVSASLDNAGFTTVTPADARNFSGTHTTLRYGPGDAAAAKLVARYLDDDVVYEPTTDSLPAAVVVITAQSLAGVRETPAAPDQVPEPPSVPSSTTPGSTTTTGPFGTTTTAGPSSGGTAPPTTVVGFVPDNPPPGVTCG